MKPARCSVAKVGDLIFNLMKSARVPLQFITTIFNLRCSRPWFYSVSRNIYSLRLASLSRAFLCCKSRIIETNAMPFHALKVVCNENQGKGHEGGILSVYRSQTVAIEVCLLFNFAVVFIFNVFPFPPSEAQSLEAMSPLIGKNAANYSPPICIRFLCNGGR